MGHSTKHGPGNDQKPCSNCSEPVAAEAVVCPECGVQIDSVESNDTLQQTLNTIDEYISRDHFKFGFLFGTLAFVAGYIATYLIREPQVAWYTKTIPKNEYIGWVFYAHHGVPVTPGETTISVMFGRAYGAIWALLLLGILVYRRTNNQRTFQSKAAGAVAGYTILAILGAMLFTVTPENTRISVGPDMTQSIVLMGLIHPVLFGGLGASIPYMWERSNHDSEKYVVLGTASGVLLLATNTIFLLALPAIVPELSMMGGAWLLVILLTFLPIGLTALILFSGYRLRQRYDNRLGLVMIAYGAVLFGAIFVKYI